LIYRLLNGTTVSPFVGEVAVPALPIGTHHVGLTILAHHGPLVLVLATALYRKFSLGHFPFLL